MTKFKLNKWFTALAVSSVLMTSAHSSVANTFDKQQVARVHQSAVLTLGAPKHKGRYQHGTDKYSVHKFQMRELSSGGKLRSRSDAISEVKRKYPNCEILKVKLDERSMVYRVRILTSEGRVSVVSINANK